MSVNRIQSPVDIAVTGLRAESLRLNVIARNIANANTSRTDTNEPYRRQDVILSTGGDIDGVSIEEIVPDMNTAFKRIFKPGHPDADKNGYVLMPNVDVPVEMMNMIVATRSYQANVAVLKRYQDIMNLTLELLR